MTMMVVMVRVLADVGCLPECLWQQHIISTPLVNNHHHPRCHHHHWHQHHHHHRHQHQHRQSQRGHIVVHQVQVFCSLRQELFTLWCASIDPAARQLFEMLSMCANIYSFGHLCHTNDDENNTYLLLLKQSTLSS